MENETMDTQTVPDTQADASMTNAERIERLRREGVFEAYAYLNDLIGPGKLYANSTDYLHARRAMRAQLERED